MTVSASHSTEGKRKDFTVMFLVLLTATNKALLIHSFSFQFFTVDVACYFLTERLLLLGRKIRKLKVFTGSNFNTAEPGMMKLQIKAVETSLRGGELNRREMNTDFSLLTLHHCVPQVWVLLLRPRWRPWSYSPSRAKHQRDPGQCRLNLLLGKSSLSKHV